MTNSAFNFKIEDIIGKVEEVIRPFVEAFDNPEESPVSDESDTGYNAYVSHHDELVTALKDKIADIEKSEALTIIDKNGAQIELFKIWAGLVR